MTDSSSAGESKPDDALRPMWDRIARAEKQLEQGTEKGWYFALLGFDADFDRYVFKGLARIQRVDEPPDPMFLQFAAKDPRVATPLGRYALSIRWELVLPPFLASNDDTKHFTLAWQIVSAIRLSSLAELLIPAVSDYPWSSIPGIRDNRARIGPVEDVPGARILSPGNKVSKEQLTGWLDTYLPSWS